MRFERAAFVVDASLQVAVGRAVEHRDFYRRSVAAAEPHDYVCAVVFVQPFGERHGAEQPCGIVPLLFSSDVRKVVELCRLAVFTAAACVQIRQDFLPGRVLRRLALAHRCEEYPDEDTCRYHE